MSVGAYCRQCGEWLPEGAWATFQVMMPDQNIGWGGGLSFCMASCLGIFVEEAGHITLKPVEVAA